MACIDDQFYFLTEIFIFCHIFLNQQHSLIITFENNTHDYAMHKEACAIMQNLTNNENLHLLFLHMK